MKIAVIGATGYVGNAVVQELAGRGHEVTAFARNTDKVFQAQNVAAVSADVNAADFADKLAGFDAVVSAFNPGWTNPNIGADFTRGANSIVEAAKAAQVPYLLERVHSLRSRTPKKAKATICRLVLNLRSQFFQSRLFFSNQEKLRSTTHRFGNTAKRCNSFRLAISTCAPINSCTDEANALPV